MASDPEHERVMEQFRAAQQLKERADARRRWGPPAKVLAALAAVAAIAAVVFFFGLPIYWQFQTTDLVKSFCRAAPTHDTHAQYTLLSSAVRQQVSESDFASRVQTAQLIDCETLAQAGFNPDHSTATMTVSLVYTAGDGTRDEKATFALRSESDGWRIAGIQSPTLTLP